MSAAEEQPHARPGDAMALRAQNLVVGYGNVGYVQDFSLDVRRGEIIALLGANGAGKTTTLLGIAGVLKPLAGTVELNGQLMTAPTYSRARNGLAFITQEKCVFMDLSLRDNLRVGGCDPDGALEIFPELRPHLKRTVGLLSGGQQQMLAVARAIARRPSVLLADELSLGLAPQVVDRILAALSDASRRDNLAVVMVEQQVDKALELADRCVVLRRGKIELTGPAQAMRSRMKEIRDLYL
jgi:ABC-type branched-subunit amino acid transport system ATPase component